MNVIYRSISIDMEQNAHSSFSIRCNLFFFFVDHKPYKCYRSFETAFNVAAYFREGTLKTSRVLRQGVQDFSVPPEMLVYIKKNHLYLS